MVQIRLKKEDIEAMIKDQLKITECTWENNDIIIEMDLDKLTKKEVEIKEIVKYPIYVEPRPFPNVPWEITCISNHDYRLNYRGN